MGGFFDQLSQQMLAPSWSLQPAADNPPEVEILGFGAFDNYRLHRMLCEQPMLAVLDTTGIIYLTQRGRCQTV